MKSKKEILKHVADCSPEEIADAVRSGVVSLYELGKETSGEFTPLLKKKVKDLLEKEPVPVVESESDIPETVQVAETPSVVEVSEAEGYNIPDISEILSSSVQTERQTTQVDSKKKQGMFSNPFSFKGRIRRTEFAISLIIYYIFNYLLGGMMGSLLKYAYADAYADAYVAVIGLLMLIFMIPLYWFLWAQSAKRCHDRGNSGWFQLIPFYILWLIFAGSQPGSNKYGDCPK